MRIGPIAVVLGSLLALPALAAPPAKAAPVKATKAAVVPVGWKQMSSDEGKYSAVFPEEPASEFLTAEDGTHLATLFILAMEEGSVAYISSYTDAAPSRLSGGADKTLSDSRDGAIRSTKGQLVSEKKITFDGHPGRELVILAPSGMRTRVRMFLVGTRIYQVMVTMPNATFDEAKVGTFLDSFRLTK